MSALTKESAPSKRSATAKIALAVVAAILAIVPYFGFRLVRGLMLLGYVDSAIGTMRVLNGAETQFAKEHPDRGYTCDLSELPRTGDIQRLLSGHGIDNDYAFEIAGCQAPDAPRPNSVYSTIARPLHAGQPAFCSDQSGLLKADYSGSIEKCRANGLPVLAGAPLTNPGLTHRVWPRLANAVTNRLPQASSHVNANAVYNICPNMQNPSS